MFNSCKKMEQVEVTKADAEKKVDRILKLLKRRTKGKREPELVALVEDFHKQYQFLHSQYNRLKRESGKKSFDSKGDENYFYDSSGSDSEYYSAMDIETNDNIAFNHNDSSNIQEELESALTKIADLNHQLASKTEEKEALASDHLVALRKLQEIEIVNRDLRTEVDDRRSEVDVMKQELDSLCRQKIESDSQYLIQVKTLKEELARKSRVEQIIVEENEGIQMQVMELESEVDDLRKHKHKLEDNERSNFREINRLREETSHLNGKIVELEEALFRQRDLELSAKKEFELMQKQLEFMKMEKSVMELWIADQKRIKKETEENTNNSMDPKSKVVRRLSRGTNFNINVLERKMEDLEQEFRQKIEDNIRILYQRITVAEKMHDESKDVFKTTKEKLEQKNRALGENLLACEAELSELRVSMDAGKKSLTESNTKLKQENGALGKKLAACEAELRKLRDPMEPVKNASTESNLRLEQENGALRKKLANYEVELKKLRNTMDAGKDAFSESNSRLEQENGALREKLATCEAELRKSKTSVKAGQKALAESNSRLEQENRKLREKVTTSEAEMSKLRDSMEVCKNALDESNSRLEHGNGELKEKLSTCEVEVRKSRELMEVCNNALNESNSKLSICEAEFGKLRNTMEKDNETEQPNAGSMLEETGKENESLKEKVSSLEAKLSEEGKENIKLLRSIAQLKTRVGEFEKITKEKDETLSGREKEKREAIRELCLLIDYHRSRCDHLWEMFSKNTTITKKTNMKFLCV